MAYQARMINHSFACEIIGLNVWEKQDARTIQELQVLWREVGVLVFRRQCLSEDELADFTGMFGPLERTVRTDWASRVRPEVGIISNLKDGEGRNIGGLGAQEVQWHSDQSYMLTPATGAALYAVEIAHAGGTTSWANLVHAYAGLPDRLKHAVEGQQAIFAYTKRLSGYQASDRSLPAEARNHTPAVVHPLVHTHPVTGQKALYLDPTCTVGIVGMDEAAGNALLDALAAHATQPEFVYQHHWQVGDLLLWDNGFLLHRREPFPASERRLMKRMTMLLPREQHIVPDGVLAAAS
jgi:taurine dioxygenase